MIWILYSLLLYQCINGYGFTFKSNHIIHYDQQLERIFFSKNDFLNENLHNVKEKDIISISPGGWHGFYMFGVTTYISNHYDLTNYVFTGASAGGWTSLFMSYKHDISELLNELFRYPIPTTKMKQTESYIKHRTLELCNSNDFDFKRVYIGVTSFHKYHVKTHIFNNFRNLEDALDCCIGSSHIPFITGNLLNIYNGMNTFDGGFSAEPYLQIKKPKLHITPNIWNKGNISNFESFYRSFVPDRNLPCIKTIFEQGYQDSKTNKHHLDLLFERK